MSGSRWIRTPEEAWAALEKTRRRALREQHWRAAKKGGPDFCRKRADWHEQLAAMYREFAQKLAEPSA